MKEVYFISGLGADQRLLQYLTLQNANVHYIRWIRPQKEESWQAYAGRLAEQIKHPHPVLIGISMGGMMAIEINKLLPIEKTILISSAKTRHEIPFYFRFLKIFRIHQWVSFKLLTRIGLIAGSWLFGAKNKAEKQLLREIIKNTDKTFFRWAWHRTASWENEYIPENLIHIHGSKDYMLPAVFIKNVDYTIKDGTHLMVLHEAEEISRILDILLKS